MSTFNNTTTAQTNSALSEVTAPDVERAPEFGTITSFMDHETAMMAFSSEDSQAAGRLTGSAAATAQLFLTGTKLPKIRLPDRAKEGVHWVVTSGEGPMRTIFPETAVTPEQRGRNIRMGVAIGYSKGVRVWAEWQMEGSDKILTDWVFRPLPNPNGKYPVLLFILLEEPDKPVKTVVLKTYRSEALKYTVEATGGGMKQQDMFDARRTARREAKEETGYGDEEDTTVDEPVLICIAPGEVDINMWLVVLHVPSYRSSEPQKRPHLEPGEAHTVHIVDLANMLTEIQLLAEEEPKARLNGIITAFCIGSELAFLTKGWTSLAALQARHEQEEQWRRERETLLRENSDLKSQNESLMIELSTLRGSESEDVFTQG